MGIASFAGEISLTSSLTCEFVDPEIKAKLILVNKGDEAAYQVYVKFEMQDKQWQSKVYSRLEYDQILEIELTEVLETMKAGIYPFIAKIHFKDRAGYPMTTIVVTPFVYREYKSLKIFVEFPDTQVAQRKKGKIIFSNMDTEDLDLSIRILVPDELSVDPDQISFFLKARSKDKQKFTLKNFSAIAGASYPVWTITEYENEDWHFTHLSSGTIVVTPSVTIFKTYWWLWLGLAGLLLFVFVGVNILKRKRPSF